MPLPPLGGPGWGPAALTREALLPAVPRPLSRWRQRAGVRAAPTRAPPWQRLQALGKPLIVGLAVFAVIGGLLTYALVSGGWWL